MAGRNVGEARTVLEQLLRQQDRTYEEVAAEFERLARTLGERGLSITARHLRRLASGERSGTTPATRRVLHAMFNLPVDELLRPWGGDQLVDPSRAAVVVPASQTEVELLEMAAEESRRFALDRDLPMSGEVIEGLHEEVRDLANLYGTQPLPTILGRLVAAQGTILSFLERRQTPANARELYFLATIVGALLANAANDVSKPDLALTHARTAYLWADYTGHDGLRTWVRGLQSYICFWADRSREALRYADLGAQTTPQTTGTASAWLYAGQARAWASLGNAEQARANIQRAEEAQERARGDELDEMGGLCVFGRPKLLYYAGRALATLPTESDDADRLSSQAVRAYQDRDQPGWDFTCLADSHISLALARVSRGELDGVADSLRPVLALPPEKRIHDLVRTMHLVHRSLNRFDSAESRDLQETIEGFGRTSLPNVLG
ncbi:hypothetical protein [Plantactinospora endophytica]|uniref:XRE family transcriptional regulator n=1 Tax=Plantactinospora endophytica TaxID=673535 RepID=A0ABQ4DZG5_9ACTN|nr:hypothetical protein [Plantactinospora endophytica]GIG87482.1 hypothetical protein Pen02_24180 [Plantactinospora endophytica]